MIGRGGDFDHDPVSTRNSGVPEGGPLGKGGKIAKNGCENSSGTESLFEESEEQKAQEANPGLHMNLMLVSKDKKQYKRTNVRKVSRGAFYTTKPSWLTAPVCDFLEERMKTENRILDPFAGSGHLLSALQDRYNVVACGYDLLGETWEKNDSLISVPNPHRAIVCTNPPYLAKHSAKRKGVWKSVAHYYDSFYDLYERAIFTSMSSADAGVFIVPETFLHSKFPKPQLRSVSVILENPFADTENPVCVACFDSRFNDGESGAKVYIGDNYICDMKDIRRDTYAVSRRYRISFNDAAGNIGLKAVDGTRSDDRIRFSKLEDFQYDRRRISDSSRLLTCIHVPAVKRGELDRFLDRVNRELEDIRSRTADLLLSPFKGNNKEGRRRRRLDYALARYLIERTLDMEGGLL